MSRIRYSFLFILILLLPSCTKQNIRHNLKQMMSRSIVLPEQLERVQADTIVVIKQPSSAKCVVYIDSSECMSCRIDRLIRYTALYYSGYESPLFDLMVIVSPSLGQKNHVIHQLQLSVDFPVYLDPRNEFLELNPHIPKEKKFHSFLIDKFGKVIFVGDPTSSDRMMELFLEALRTIQ